MSRVFAIIESGVVTNLILAGAWENAVDVTDLTPRPAIGWLYDGEVFSAPPYVEPVVPTTTKMTHLGFLDRMQPDEWARFEGLLSASAEARFAKAKFDIARDVDVARADVQTFAYTLRAVGVLLTDERVTALLAPIPLTSEHALP